MAFKVKTCKCLLVDEPVLTQHRYIIFALWAIVGVYTFCSTLQQSRGYFRLYNNFCGFLLLFYPIFFLFYPNTPRPTLTPHFFSIYGTFTKKEGLMLVECFPESFRNIANNSSEMTPPFSELLFEMFLNSLTCMVCALYFQLFVICSIKPFIFDYLVIPTRYV